MKEEEIAQNLEDLAQEQAPSPSNLWPSIQVRLDAETVTQTDNSRSVNKARPRLRWVIVPATILALALALLYAGLSLFAPARTVSAAELLARADKAKDTVLTSFHGVQVSDFRETAGEPLKHARVETWFIAPHKIRQEGSYPRPDGGKDQLLWVSNGTSGWKYDSTIGVANQLKHNELQRTFGASSLNAMIGDSFQIQSFYNVQVMGTENVAGRTAYVVELTLKPSDEWPKGYTPATGEHVKFWLDNQYFFILKYQAWDAEGNELATDGYESFEINAPVDPAVFEISPPAK